ncbi:uncharacterized protein METZ01_LOCUS517732, partial [marine metagenome]
MLKTPSPGTVIEQRQPRPESGPSHRKRIPLNIYTIRAEHF